MATWLSDQLPSSLDIEGGRRDLRNVWIDAFSGYARTCYEACSRITTLYEGNQILQSRDGAPADRLQIIPNGVDYDGYLEGSPGNSPSPADGRSDRSDVPIKDVKTFIRAAALLREMVPDVHVLILGPTDEDLVYFRECQEMLAHLNLENTFEFSGRVKLHDYLGNVDVIALTNISEAQPLVFSNRGSEGAERSDRCWLVSRNSARTCGRDAKPWSRRFRHATLQSDGHRKGPRRSSPERGSEKAIRRSDPGKDGEVLQQTRSRRPLSRPLSRASRDARETPIER